MSATKSHLRAIIMIAGLTAAGLGAAGLSGCDGERAQRDATTPSGFAVPRYLVLRFNEINGRAGPSEDHRILWTYHAKGLPVQVIAETQDWRRICDPEGGISWVRSRMLEGGRAVMRTGDTPVSVRRRPDAAAAEVAVLPPKGVAKLDRCEKGWCQVRVGKTHGWTPEDQVWGTGEGMQCEGLPTPRGPVAGE